jgi:hypothetical protein
MKTWITKNTCLALALAAGAVSARAQFQVPYANGSDGALIVTNTSAPTVLDLRLAVPAVWTNSNTGTNIGLGIYDSNVWAVVYKFTTISVSNGATLVFTNRPTHAPVVFLVSNDVIINGSISLDGQTGTSDPINLPDPGPGGFRGGAESQSGLSAGGGFGPGGGSGYQGQGMTTNYGSPLVVPLMGGSGGNGANGWNGGAGGGAVLIAAQGNVTINAGASIHANGGYSPNSESGSGGAIRVVGNQILGSGTIQAEGAYSFGPTPGWIRLESYITGGVSSGLSLYPQTVGQSPTTPVTIFPPANAPTVQITSVAGLPAPADPTAMMSASGDDSSFGNTNIVTITLATSNFPTNQPVYVIVRPRNGSAYSAQAAVTTGNNTAATWQATTTLPQGHMVLQAWAQ